MISCKLCFTLIIFLKLFSAQLPVITLNLPVESSTIVKRNMNHKVSTTVRYDINSDLSSLQNLELCMQLDERSDNRQLLPLSCFIVAEGSNANTLNDLPLGDFIVSLVWRNTSPSYEVQEESKVSASFSVKAIDTLLPIIEFISHNPIRMYSFHAIRKTEEGFEMVVAAISNKQTDVTVEYSLGSSLLNIEGYDICAQLTHVDTNLEVLKLTCVPNTQRSLTFQAMNIGSYILVLSIGKIQPGNDQREMYESSKKDLNIIIKNLNDVLPVVSFEEKIKEVALISPEESVDVLIHLELKGLPSALSLVQICVQVDKEDKTSIIPLRCLEAPTSQITIRKLQTGIHNVQLILRLKTEPFTLFQSTEANMLIEVRHSVEFVPTYTWQRLHAWHSIPIGIQTRLPLSSSGSKEARIPEPWRLQLSMPSPCKYFLRIDVTRITTLSQILHAAGKQCKISPSCFTLTADDKPLVDVQENMETTDFFNTKHGLLVHADCA
mmetsp:Transcript_17383/g.16722  ORF Transcript_17383/g.16722 Transcript_17383/m.16722 type:complete len:493 (-) Transcript_17383:36-1514(-)